MKKILLIGTGGTISSKDSGEGLTPSLSAEELLKFCPGIKNICEVSCIQPINLDSTNMRPGHWLLLAEIIKENYDAFDGFVITHGTDTMAYTAAGISYLVQDSKKPIVLTGAQKPMGELGSDATRNIMDAFTVASSDELRGVMVVFFGSIIAGTRARKNFSMSFDAFGSVNYPELGRVYEGKVLKFIEDKQDEEPKFYGFLNPNVGLLKFVPGMRNDVLRYLVDQYDGLVIETFGVGGIPEYSDFYEQIERALDLGKFVVITTQVSNEGSNLSVYKVGAGIKNNLKILEAHDMTTEAAFAKLMWVLGITTDYEEAKELFYKTICHDIMYK